MRHRKRLWLRSRTRGQRGCYGGVDVAEPSRDGAASRWAVAPADQVVYGRALATCRCASRVAPPTRPS
jgi:hypothetical protein